MPDQMLSYFCGCCWRRLTELQKRARQILTTDSECPGEERITTEGLLYSAALMAMVLIGQLTLERPLTPMEFAARDRAASLVDRLRDEHSHSDREWRQAMQELTDQQSAVGWPSWGRWCH